MKQMGTKSLIFLALGVVQRGLLLILFAAAESFAEPKVATDDRLPPDSIELKHNQAPAISTPWQLPKPGDPLYDVGKEAEIRRENKVANKGDSHLVHVFERGVFKGYQTLSWKHPSERPAKEMNDVFTLNAKLPPDAVQLSDAAEPNKKDYFHARPKTRPDGVPPDCVAVKVLHRGKLIGWTFMPERSVALLHQLK